MSALNVKNYIHVEVNGIEQARTFTVTDTKNDGGFTAGGPFKPSVGLSGVERMDWNT